MGNYNELSEEEAKQIDEILNTKDVITIYKTQERHLRELLDCKVEDIFDDEVLSVFKNIGVSTIGDIMVCWPRIYWECCHRPHTIKMVDDVSDLMESLRFPLPSPLKNNFSKLKIE